MTSDITLKPCPFCGSKARAVLFRRGAPKIVITCPTGCYALKSCLIELDEHGPEEVTLENIDAAFAVAAAEWNTRKGENK